MIVKDVMSSKIAVVNEQDCVYEAAQIMKNHDVGVVPVVDQEGGVAGIITDRDIILRCVAENKDASTCKTSEIMTSSATSIEPNQSLAEALQLMSSQQIRRLPVTEGGELKGIVSLADIARIRASAETAITLTEISMP